MNPKNDAGVDTLSAQQRKAMPYFLTCPSIQKACKKAGISRMTFYRWLADPVFKEELDRLTDESYRETVNILKRHTEQAASHLVGLMKTRDPVMKRKVCNDILNHLLKHEANTDIEDRLQRLEQIAEENKL